MLHKPSPWGRALPLTLASALALAFSATAIAQWPGAASVRSLTHAQLPASPDANPMWTGAAPIPAGAGVLRYAHTQCPNDPDSFYLISGVTTSFGIATATSRYDVDTDTWTTLAPIPTGQEGPAAVCHDGKIHVVGGGGTTQHFIYDIASDTWDAGAAAPRGVWGAAMGAHDGRIFLVGGDNDFSFGGTSNQVNIYDIATDTWTGTGTDMPAAATTAGSRQSGQYLYVVGGWGDATPATNSDQTQRYDLATDTWETGPTFTSARADFGLAVSNEFLYAMGGDANGGGAFDATNVIEVLDLATWPEGEWITIEPLPAVVTAVHGGFCTSTGTVEAVWSVGGYTGSAASDVNHFELAPEGCRIPWEGFSDGFEEMPPAPK